MMSIERLETRTQTHAATHYVIPATQQPGRGHEGTPRHFTCWVPLVAVADEFVAQRLAELEDLEWEARFQRPSPQRDALRAIIEQGREEYAAGETEAIIGDTFA
jgi:hypothetical protein